MKNEDTFFKIEFFVTFVIIISVMILERVANRSNTIKTETNILNQNNTKNLEKTSSEKDQDESEMKSF